MLIIALVFYVRLHEVEKASNCFKRLAGIAITNLQDGLSVIHQAIDNAFTHHNNDGVHNRGCNETRK